MSRRRRAALWVASGTVVTIVLVLGIGPRIAARSLNGTVGPPLQPVSEQARRIHGTLIVADLHTDALLWARSLLRRGSYGHADLPRLTEGRVALQGFTVVTKVPKGMNYESNDAETDNISLLAVTQAWPPATWRSLAQRAVHQAHKLHAAAERSRDRLTVLRSAEDLDRFLERWDRDPGIVAGFLGIEGAHALEGDLANVDLLFQAGFRMFGLAHFIDNEVGGSAHGLEKGGLTDFGRRVMERMGNLGIILDVAHASPRLFAEVLPLTAGPVVSSHTGVQATCGGSRNLSDEQLRQIAATGGLVGIGLWEGALCGNTPGDWVRAVRHAVEVAGVDHVGLGSDWDGAVDVILDASQTVHLTQALLDEGFEEGEIRRIMGGNAIRVLREALPSPST